jgi:hypothetical protein
MDRKHEIVRVLSSDKLVDSESFERRYYQHDGNGVPVGFYIVSWPAAIHHTEYDETATFVGPFKLQIHAEMVLRHHLGVGSSQPPVRARSNDVPTHSR